MIELSWNSDEEKYLHKCLLDSATDDPSTTMGCLLVIFYIQVTFLFYYTRNMELSWAFGLWVGL